MSVPNAAPAPGSARAIINQSFNAIGSCGTWVLKNCGKSVAPSVLGWTGGWIVGVGRGTGLLQGAVSWGWHRIVQVNVEDYFEANKGEGPTQIHRGTANFFEVVGAVAGVAMPILITSYCGETVMGNITSHLSKDGTLYWLLSHNNNYTWVKGCAVAIAPTIAQHWITWWRNEENHNKRH